MIFIIEESVALCICSFRALRGHLFAALLILFRRKRKRGVPDATSPEARGPTEVDARRKAGTD
jgi:hypothetical protein